VCVCGCVTAPDCQCGPCGGAVLALSAVLRAFLASPHALALTPGSVSLLFCVRFCPVSPLPLPLCGPPPPRHSLHRHAAALPDQREARRSCQPVKRQCPPAPRHHRCDGWDVSGATHVTRPLFGDVAPLQVGVTISAPTREGNVVRAMMSHMVKLRCRTVCLFGGYLFSTFF
jgi:hypothetical protein